MYMKYYNETPCISILDKQKSHFKKKKTENRKVKQFQSGGSYQREGGGYLGKGMEE
jgi:hypothetical protein